MGHPSALSPQRRKDDWARLTAQPLDVLVVGGGVTGAGAALDAVTRGLSVGLVEAQDWAAGTSSRSSKLVHGGLRYLQMLDFHLVHEGLAERGLLLRRLAPHLVRPVPILYPLRRPVLERAYVGAGIALYDLLGASTGRGRGLPRHRHLGKRATLASAPCLRASALAGAVVYWDAQVDDARYVVETVRTAASHGVVPLNRAAVTAFSFGEGRVTGAVVRDEETGAEHAVRARVTISATGAWTEQTEALAGRGRAVQVRPSKGAHILVRREKLASATGMVLRTDRSVLFVLPWGEHWLIGTTDTDWPYAKARPLASAADVGYILSELNAVLERPLSKDDVEATYAGLRPLIAGSGVVRGPGEGRKDLPTTKLSREHVVSRPLPGLVVVSGGKYTTYRVMAADAVDAAVAEGRFHALACRTAAVPLLGAQGWAGAWDARAAAAREARVPLPEMERLMGRYGTLVPELVEELAAHPAWHQRLAGTAYLKVEVAYAVTHEGARHLDDVLARRTRLAMGPVDEAVAAAPEAAEVMAPLLGWDRATISSEVDDYCLQAQLVRRVALEAQDDGAAARLADATPARLPVP
ncbi:MAG: glycerol-3-phosphate dehydrogenase/oxidase [Acidimicrobiales bacterium]